MYTLNKTTQAVAKVIYDVEILPLMEINNTMCVDLWKQCNLFNRSSERNLNNSVIQ